MAAYAWPGNLDDLAVVVREAHERASGGEVKPATCRERFNGRPKRRQAARQDDSIALESFLAKVEMELIGRALRKAKNNKSKAAKLLGLTRPRLYRRLEQLGLDTSDDGNDEMPPE